MSDGDDSGMEEYGTEWQASSSEILDCTIRSSSDLLFDVGRLRLNELAIALSEEVTLGAGERWSGQDIIWVGWEKSHVWIHHRCQIHQGRRHQSGSKSPLVSLGYLPLQPPIARLVVEGESLRHVEVVRYA